MKLQVCLALVASLAFTAAVSAQPVQHLPPSFFMVRYFSDLSFADSYVDLSNDGSQVASIDSTGTFFLGTTAVPGAVSQTQNICANVYTFDANEEMVSCCTCPITANGLKSLSVKNDLVSNTLTPGVPLAVVVKLVATTPIVAFSTSFSISGGCDATILPVPFTAVEGPGNFTYAVFSLHAWGATPHLNTASGAYQLGETEFSQADTQLTSANEFDTEPLVNTEITNMTQTCAFINSVASGFGICKSCLVRGLGAAQQ